MIRKLLLASVLTLTVPFLSAAETVTSNDDFLAGVKQLTQEQMESITGEDITVIEYRYIEGTTIEVIVSYNVYENSNVTGYVRINLSTGDVEQHIVPIN